MTLQVTVPFLTVYYSFDGYGKTMPGIRKDQQYTLNAIKSFPFGIVSKINEPP